MRRRQGSEEIHRDQPPTPSLDTDVVVVGAGAGGLATAVTAAHHGLRVVVLERADVCGGATAWSGGWMWAPGNPLAHADGVHEDVERFRTYLRAALGADYDAARVDAFLAAAPEMVRLFHEQTGADVRARARRSATSTATCPAPAPGTVRSGPPRSTAARSATTSSARCAASSTRPRSSAWASWRGRTSPPSCPPPAATPAGCLHATRRVARHVYDLVTRRRGMQLVNGTALVGRLLRSALDVGVRRARVVPGHGASPRGRPGHRVVADTPKGPLRITAARGVVLAAGGFPHDVSRRRALFPRTPTGTEHWSLAPETADGAGTTLGESAGGRLRTDVASPAAWCPVSLVPYRSGLPRRWRRTGVFPHIMDRAKPGSIGVLSTGRRFVNEANGYYDYVAAMIAAAPEGEPVQAWQIADARFVRRFPLGMAKPRPVPLFPYLRSGYLKKGRTLAELARACGIDPDGLTATVEEFNRHAARGEDPEFGRAHDPVQPVRRRPVGRPEPVARAARKGPYYAVRIVPGSFGTFAGLATDARARVLDGSGESGDARSPACTRWATTRRA
jgi:succinate dehydrogenase/fumarate reductase flavoprotein subunit